MPEVNDSAVQAIDLRDLRGQATVLVGIPEWLNHTAVISDDGRYRFSLLVEVPSNRQIILEELKRFVEEAHSDAVAYLRQLAGRSLDPLGEEMYDSDPAEGYPHRFGLTSLKGYFGECFAAIVALQFRPFEEGWEVPAFLFRFHTVALQQLERLRQGEAIAEAMPGRTGDDFVAFKRDETGRITKALVGESKCTANHSGEMISKAHAKISDSLLKPVDTLRLIEVLSDRNDEWGQSWIRSLREFYLDNLPPGYERLDFVSYVCGQAPVRSERTSWIAPDQPHAEYTGGRRLHCVEAHIGDVNALVRAVYGQTQ